LRILCCRLRCIAVWHRLRCTECLLDLWCYVRRNGWFGSALVDGLVVARGGCAQAAVAEAAAAVAVGAAAVAVRCLSFEAL
jgi:hypothetical protein